MHESITYHKYMRRDIFKNTSAVSQGQYFMEQLNDIINCKFLVLV